MSLKGIYVNKSTGEKLEITDANDANGQLKGFMNVPQNGGSLKVNVDGHYHFVNSTGAATSIEFTGTIDNTPTTPSIYQSWAGLTNRDEKYKELNVMGAQSVLQPDGKGIVSALSGPFVRQ